MNYVTFAIPFFIAAIIIEMLWGRWGARGNTYRFADTINSLQLGTLSRLRGILQLGLLGALFEVLLNQGLFTLSPAEPWVWITTFVAYDLCYYFSHRYGHEWRILWASHVAHHQSEEFNLSTALRQTSTGWLNSIFYLPLYILGVPVELMISVGSLNLIYQFWVHTEHVRHLGVFEWIFVTPSNHRVHHAKNPQYIDKNYGGVFIIWDRMFGTFQGELENEPCRYGITDQLNSWNPIWANIHVWIDTYKQSISTPQWSDKVKVWFKSPAWHAPGVSHPSHTQKDNWLADKYQPISSTFARALSLSHFVIHVPLVFVLLGYQEMLGQALTLLAAFWLLFGFYLQGRWLEGKATYMLEWGRLLSGGLLLITLTQLEILMFDQTPGHTVMVGSLAAYIGISAALNQIGQSGDRLQSLG